MSAYVNYLNKTFTLNGKLTIYKASELRHDFLSEYKNESNKSGDFLLDLSSVEMIDASILQLLISLKKTIESGNGKLKLKASSQTFDSLVDLFGLSADFFPKVTLV